MNNTFAFNHFNFNVKDLVRSLLFYKEAFGLEPVEVNGRPNFTLAFLGDNTTSFRLELTYLKDRTEAYDLGEQEFHLALRTPNIKEAHDLHTKMGCVCFENAPMGIYFVEDPDGYWIEVIPDRTKPQFWPEEA